MRKTFYRWLGRDFLELSGEAKPSSGAGEECAELFERFGDELQLHELSLENVVRSRLWARDRPSRDIASKVRLHALAGGARAASSGYIAPVHFNSQARIGLDLLAMKPPNPQDTKHVVEYEPPIVPPRYVSYGSLVFVSGVTSVREGLEEQVEHILSRTSDALLHATSSWDRVVRLSCYLQREQSMETLVDKVREIHTSSTAQLEISLVDAYSTEGKLCEIEVTAALT